MTASGKTRISTGHHKSKFSVQRRCSCPGGTKGAELKRDNDRREEREGERYKGKGKKYLPRIERGQMSHRQMAGFKGKGENLS